MTTACRQYEQLVQAGNRAAAAAHLRECESCRFCFARVGEPARAELSRLPSLPPAIDPVRPFLPGRACLLGLLAYACMALAAVAAVTELDGLAVLGLPSIVLGVLLVSGLIAAARLLCRVSIPGEMLPFGSVLIVSGALVFFVLAAFVLFPLDWSRGLRGDGGCLLFGIGVAAGLTPLLSIAGRRRGVREWRVAGPALGAFAGTTGLLALLQHCPIQEASHLLLMHWPVTVLAIGFGFIAGRFADSTREWS